MCNKVRSTRIRDYQRHCIYQQKLDLCIFSRYWKPTCILINQDGFGSAYGHTNLGLNSNPVFISELLSGQLLTKA